MADKLSKDLWTSFLKKQKLELDDAALLKALERYDKTDAKKPEDQLDALQALIDLVPKQVAALVKRKKELGDKPFAALKDKLYDIETLAQQLHKAAEAAAEEPDTPALLSTKMLPLLRNLRKGGVRMHAMICTAGRNTAVLIMLRAISPARRKLLAEAVDAKGGMKFIVGECLFENKALTFVVRSPSAALAKRVRQALLDQTGMRFKVAVRGDDGDDEDGEDGGEDQ